MVTMSNCACSCVIMLLEAACAFIRSSPTNRDDVIVYSVWCLAMQCLTPRLDFVARMPFLECAINKAIVFPCRLSVG